MIFLGGYQLWILVEWGGMSTDRLQKREEDYSLDGNELGNDAVALELGTATFVKGEQTDEGQND